MRVLRVCLFFMDLFGGIFDYLAEVPRAIVYEKLSAVLTTDPT